MSIQQTETIQRLWDRFLRDQLAHVPLEERRAYTQQFEERLAELVEKDAGTRSGGEGFLDLIGVGPKGRVGFEEIAYPYLKADFDDNFVASQLHAAAELYFIYQYERSKVFQVANILLRLFHSGSIKLTRGPGANSLYLLEKWQPQRYSLRHRDAAYRRAFNYGVVSSGSTRTVVNVNFHRQLVGFMDSVAQFLRDMRIGDVIRGSQELEHRAFGSVATVQRLGVDLRYALNRATYGNIYALSVETGHYLKQVLELLDAPDIKKAFDANTKWNVVETVSQRYLGSMAEISQRAKMAESGRRVLLFVADHDFKTGMDPSLFEAEMGQIGPHAEAWLAAYRMTREGRGFVNRSSAAPSSLDSIFGIRSRRTSAPAYADL
ncbi:MAG TPA: hypothetical protein VKR31_02560 [Rhizomicrobium sp.]|nr:hypothetical protein [Rhizomicrobium sp.]